MVIKYILCFVFLFLPVDNLFAQKGLQKIKDAELSRYYDDMKDSTIFFGHVDARGTSYIFHFNGVSAGNTDIVTQVYFSMMYRVNIRSIAQASGQNTPVDAPDFMMIVDDSIRIRLTGRIDAGKSGRSTGILGLSTDEMTSNYYLTTEQVRTLSNANSIRTRWGDVPLDLSTKTRKSLTSLCDRLSGCRE